MIEAIFEGQELKTIRAIAKAANAIGYEIFLIGGIVRDVLLGKKPKDIDIVVVGDALNFAKFLQEKMICRIIKEEPNLKTAQVDFGNGFIIDFASTRHEIYGDKKGIPMISSFGCSLQDDVIRRDFSVNALAISLNPSDYGKVTDYVNGQEDLKNKKLSVLHDFSFLDDPTRIIRAFKFSKRLGFTVEEHTQKLMEEYFEQINYSEIASPMRIKKEFYEIFRLNSPETMNDFYEKGVYRVLSDKVNKVDFDKVKEVIEKFNLKSHMELIYFLSIFLRKENYPILQHFNFTKSEIKIIQDLKLAGEFKGRLSDIEIYQMYSNRSKESLALELLLKNNEHIQKYMEGLNAIKIEISGEDLLMMGVPESKSYGAIFDKVMEEKIKGSLPDKVSELRYVRKLLMNNEV